MSERLFGRYILIKTIGVGGMAEVHKARLVGAKGFSRPVALKMTLPHLASDKGFIEAFVREAKLVSLIDHPNIVKITDFGGENDVYYIAMDYVWGKDLKTMVLKSKQVGKPVKPEFAAYIISQVCQGLDYAHNLTSMDNRPLNLVHRDISPQNILLSFGGEVKVLDFGIAKVTSEETLGGKTQAEVIKGKVSYMSPEQAEGKPLDARSDLFSLGIVLYELVTGKNPFLMKDPILTLDKVRRADYISTSDSGIQAPKDLEHILQKCLLKNPDERYQSAAELNSDIEEFIHSRGKKLARKDVEAYMEELFSEEKQKDERELADENRQVKESEADYLPDSVETSREPVKRSSEKKAIESDSGRPEKPRFRMFAAIGGVIALVLTSLMIWLFSGPGNGKIIVETANKNVSILLDGEKIADSGPVMKDKVSIGEPHKVEVIADGFEKWSKTFILEGKTPRVFEVSLEKTRVELEVSAIDMLTNLPVSAEVYINNRSVGRTPVTIKEVDPGLSHTLSVSKDGYKTFEKSFKADAPGNGESGTLKVEMYQNTGKVVIVSENSKVRMDVSVNGRVAGKTPISINNALLGFTYKIDASAEGYEEYSEEVFLEGEDLKKVLIPAKKAGKEEPGLLSINTSPWTNVFIGDRSLGTTPLSKIELSPGIYEITLVNSRENIDKVIEVTVEEGKNTRKYFKLKAISGK